MATKSNTEPDLFSAVDQPAPAPKPRARRSKTTEPAEAKPTTSRRRKTTEPAEPTEAKPRARRRKTTEPTPESQVETPAPAPEPEPQVEAIEPAPAPVATTEPESDTTSTQERALPGAPYAPEMEAPEESTAAIIGAAVEAELKRHPERDRAEVEAERSEMTVDLGPRYAREMRSILAVLGERHRVQNISVPKAGPGRYSKGAEVLLIGLEGDIARLLVEWERIGTLLAALLANGKPLNGEDAATFRSSLLLGYRLGLMDAELSRADVEAVVSGKKGSNGIAWKSTGSGTWDGYQAALADAATITADVSTEEIAA